MNLDRVHPLLLKWARHYSHLREITTTDVITATDPLPQAGAARPSTALRSLFSHAKTAGTIFRDPARSIHDGQRLLILLQPLQPAEVDRPRPPPRHLAARLAVALAAVHAAGPRPSGSFISAMSTSATGGWSSRAGPPARRPDQRLLLAWLQHRGRRWPGTANPHLIIDQQTTMTTRAVSENWLTGTCRGLTATLERLRADRQLEEALTCGADPLHLTAVFRIDDTTAIKPRHRRQILDTPAEPPPPPPQTQGSEQPIEDEDPSIHPEDPSVRANSGQSPCRLPRDCNLNGVTPGTEETPVTDVIDGQSPEPAELSAADEQLLRELTERARTGGLKLSGEGGLLGKLTKMVVEGALEGEMDDHLGYGKHDPAGRNGSNSRNGHRAKTVLTDTGPVEITVPRDCDASFEPKIVAKRKRRLTGVDEIGDFPVRERTDAWGDRRAPGRGLRRRGLQTDDHHNHRPRHGRHGRMAEPAQLHPVYAVVFIDAINVKIREGQVANRPIYLALGVTVDGERDVPGLWAGEHGDGEGAKFWLRVLSEIKNRGTRDVCMLVCDGLKGLPDAVNAVWEKTIVQTCIVHLLRNSFKYASKRDWAQIAKDLKPVYTAASEAEAWDRFAEFSW